MKSTVFLSSLGIAAAAVAVGQMASGGGGNDGEDIWDIASTCGMTSLSYSSGSAFVGTYPNGTLGLAMQTVGQNQGDFRIPWNAVSGVDHPVIAQNMYRINADGRLEQIGQAWLKHAWFALQQSLCGFSCQSGGNGALLGINCADTYSAGNNSAQSDLGPRWEIKPTELRWMNGLSWNGSHFQQGAGHSNPVMHRLRVRMSDLDDTPSGATYWYEAQYNMLRNYGNSAYDGMFEHADQRFNNSRHRRTIVTHNGNQSFSFVNSGNDVNGPLVQAWGDVRSLASPTDDGMVYVSSRAVDIGGGNYRYEFCVMNYTLDTEIESITIPVNGANVSNLGFHQVLDGYWTDATTFVNESPYDVQPWDSLVDGDSVTFSAQAPEGSLLENTIRWSTMYTFWFEADSAPIEGGTDMTIIPHLQGTVAELTAGIAAPGPSALPAELTNVATTLGTNIGGNLASLLTSDDVNYSVRSALGFTANEPNVTQIRVWATSPVQVADSMDVTIESRLNQSGGTRRVRLRNYDTNALSTIDTYAIGNTEITQVSTAGGGVSQFIRDSDSRIELVSRTSVLVTFTASGFVDRYDLVTIELNE